MLKIQKNKVAKVGLV